MRCIRSLKNYSLGFTFIEMIMVVAMTAVVALAVFSMFNKGATIWQVVNSQIPDEDLNICFDKLGRDMHNVFFFSKIVPRFNKESLAMATLVESPRLKAKTVGQVGYSFDRGAKELRRELRDFSQLSWGDEGGLSPVLKGVESARFSYYIYDEKRKEYLWSDEYSSIVLPYAVRLEVTLDNGSVSQKFTKTVTLPLGGQPKAK